MQIHLADAVQVIFVQASPRSGWTLKVPLRKVLLFWLLQVVMVIYWRAY